MSIRLNTLVHKDFKQTKPESYFYIIKIRKEGGGLGHKVTNSAIANCIISEALYPRVQGFTDDAKTIA